jgi:hypothetical protein
VVNTCVQIFPQKALCEQEQGVWYGPGTMVSPTPYPSCCALQQGMPNLGFDILPLAQSAIRNDSFKLIQLTNENCNVAPPTIPVWNTSSIASMRRFPFPESICLP